MLGAGARDAIDAHAAIGRRHAPLGVDETVLEQTLKGGVERALLDLEQVARRLLDALHERVSVHRLLLEEAEHHHLERARKEVARLRLRAWCRPYSVKA